MEKMIQLEMIMKTEAEMRIEQSDKLIIEKALEKMLKDIMENPKR